MKKTNFIKIKNTIPQLSGVYTFRDKARKPLYIGKAKNLSSRVSSYFHSSKAPMIRTMLERAQSLTWQETLSDIEALILESQLIKKYHPRFNTLLRDDRQYFYVGFTKERFPKLIITHQPQNLKFKSIGPFTDGAALKLALKNLRQIFPYCTCKQNHLNYCLNYHLGNCFGFCCLKNYRLSESQLEGYQKNLKSIRNILTGKKRAVLKNLLNQLALSSKESVHSKISKLQQFFTNTKVIHTMRNMNKLLLDMRKSLLLIHSPVRIEGYDISNISGVFATGAMIVFTNGQSDKSEYRKFKIRSITSSDDTRMLREIIERRFKHREWEFPDLILVDGGKGQVNAVASVLKKLLIGIPIIGIIKNEKHFGERVLLGHKNKIIRLDDLPAGVRNLLLQIDSEAHRFAIAYYHKRHSFK